MVKLEKLFSHVMTQYLAKDFFENICVFDVVQFFAVSEGTPSFVIYVPYPLWNTAQELEIEYNSMTSSLSWL